MIVLIDNYDSFTYNLYQYLGKYEEVKVYRNDEVTVDDVVEMNPSHIVISPGPGRPDDAGICIDLIRAVAGKIPLLGVCLGHQCIGRAYGGNIIYAKELYHGKRSPIKHQGTGIFNSIESPTWVARYHSLAIDANSLPSSLEVIARTDDLEVMAIEHREHPVTGIQFHPESIMTEVGLTLIHNFITGMTAKGEKIS